jgi:hypothetical protein
MSINHRDEASFVGMLENIREVGIFCRFSRSHILDHFPSLSSQLIYDSLLLGQSELVSFILGIPDAIYTVKAAPAAKMGKEKQNGSLLNSSFPFFLGK